MEELNKALKNLKDAEKRSFSGIIYELENVISKTQAMGYSLDDILLKLQEKLPELKLKSLNQSLYLARKSEKKIETFKPNNIPEKVEDKKEQSVAEISPKKSENIGTDEARKKQQSAAKNLLNKHK